MDTQEFLSRVLAGSGHYCAFGAKKAAGGDLIRRQKFFPSIEALLDTAQGLDSNGFDAYFALATFTDPRANRPRSASNVALLKALYLDLDCGEGKDFATQTEAIAQLREFCSWAKLPRPLLINSGRGVHVYWPLDAAVPVQEWLPVATLLKQACKEFPLSVDPAVTTDAARVLRVPGTHNYKSDPPTDVAVLLNGAVDVSLSDMEARLKAVVSEVPVVSRMAGASLSREQLREASPLMDALLGNRASRFETILNKSLAGRGCAQIKSAYEDQANTPEPVWRAALSIAKFCTDGADFAHRLSQDHPEYAPDETEAKLGGIKGPYLCSKFDDLNPGLCDGCPHLGKIRSPISLGSYVLEAQDAADDNEDSQNDVATDAAADGDEAEDPTILPAVPVAQIPKYPFPYFRGANGGVYRRDKSEEGDTEETCIYHNDLYVIRRLVDPELGESVVLRLHLPKDAMREFTVPLTAVTSKEEFRKYTSMYGIAVWGGAMENLMRYISAWVIHLQGQGEARVARTQFGWTDRPSFILGEMEITASGAEFNPPSKATQSLFPAFRPRGTLEGWKEQMNFFARPGFEAHQHVIGAAFGSILMELTPVHGAILHLHSDKSGFGKTTSMLAGASTWGQPKALLLSQNDTHNTKMNRGEAYKNLPLYIDEMTNTGPKELSELAYQITEGRQRGRLTSGANQERHRGEPWRLIAVTTANAAIVDRIRKLKNSPHAEAQRVLEYRVSRAKGIDKADTDILSAALSANCGHAGPMFVQYVLRNLSQVKELLHKVQQRVDSRAGLTFENRFWSAETSAVLTGIILARQLGLLAFDTARHFDWVVNDLLNSNKKAAGELDATIEDLLVDYLREHWDNVLRIKSSVDNRGVHNKAGGMEQHLVPAEALPKGKLIARYETDKQLLYLPPGPFRAWCSDRQINFKGVIDDLVNKMGATKVRVRLSKGLTFILPPVDVWKVKLDVGGAETTEDGEEVSDAGDDQP